MRAALLLLIAAAVLGGSHGRATASRCGDLQPPAQLSSEQHPLRAEDLLALRDFGNLPGPPAVAPAFALSPDGRFIALELRQADPTTNAYCLGLFVVPVQGGPARMLAQGGELIRDNAANRTMGDFPEGWPRAVAPAWSPDGRSIAWLRRDDGRTAVWTVPLEGGVAQKVSDEPDDITDLLWNGPAILFSVQPAIRQAEADLDRAGDKGWVYDRRFWPPVSDRPFPLAPFPTVIRSLDPSTHVSRDASAPERRLFERMHGAALASAGDPVISTTGDRAWTEPKDPSRLGSPAALHVVWKGLRVECPWAICRSGIVQMWWSGPRLILLRSEGVEERERLGLYSWRVGQGTPRRLLATNDLFQGCLVERTALLCAREGSTQPRRLSRIDLGSGQVSTIFDPNPQFRAIRLGRVERLRWRNGFGNEAFGDLVLPPDHRPGQKHPLIVVQYNSRCFLRGGTGDEYPIQLLASHGFAVLSFNRPRDVGLIGAADAAEMERIDFKDWADRRNVQSAIETGIAEAAKRGVVDRKRLGITGLSEGSTAEYWALLHSHLFAAAASSTCCQSPNDFSQIGPVYRAEILAEGRPRPDEDHAGFWRAFTLQGGADTITTPLLLQLASTEFRSSLSTIDALQRFHRPVDMLVFPDEYHIKWQPAHRLAIYRRNVCWFEYWLGTPSDLCEPDDLRRWDILRRERPGGASERAAGAPPPPAS